MKRFGSDVIPLVCIAGGAVAAVGLTATFARGSDSSERRDLSCAVGVAARAPRVSVSHDGHRIVLAPGVRVGGVVMADGRECLPAHMDGVVQIDVERAGRRAAVEALRRVQVLRLDRLEGALEEEARGLEEASEELEEALEEASEELEEALEEELEARIEGEMRRLEEALARLEREIGG